MRNEFMINKTSSLTPEQQDLKKRIEKDKMKGVSAEEYDQFVLERGRDEKAEKFATILTELLDAEKKYKTLELGAGTGIFTNELNKIPNVELTCLDIRKDLLEYGIDKERIKREQIVIGDFEKQPFEQDSFDVLTGTAIMNQRQDQEAFFAETKRVLKDGGLAFFPWIHKKQDRFEKETKLLEDNGFEIVNVGEDYILAKKSD